MPAADFPHLTAAATDRYGPDEQCEQGLTAFLDGFLRDRDAERG